MSFVLTISTNYAATESKEDVAELLRKVADYVYDGYSSKSIMDYNGNKVGSFRFEDDDE